jgi:tryptophan 2,3-dioxygenase
MGVADETEADPAETMDYGGYLRLPQLLGAQRPITSEHDELLFVIIHQTSELWLKLVLHELRGAMAKVAADNLQPAFKMLTRMGRIQAQMIAAWEILATMTPFDYARFRKALGSSSGFQSWQYREFEYLLGAKDASILEAHRSTPANFLALEATLKSPSIYDESLRLLARRGFAIPADRLERDWTAPYLADPRVEAAWLTIYRDAESWWDLYELGEKLVDVEYRFQQWRFAHVKTVERIIGFKPGTGGSAGVSYLTRALERRFFPELLDLRTVV